MKTKICKLRNQLEVTEELRKVPNKPKIVLSALEEALLVKALSNGYKYITKDYDGTISFSDREPKKWLGQDSQLQFTSLGEGFWTQTSGNMVGLGSRLIKDEFKFVKWSNKPLLIEELLQKYLFVTSLTEVENMVIRHLLRMGYVYIARDGDNGLFAYKTEPVKIPNSPDHSLYIWVEKKVVDEEKDLEECEHVSLKLFNEEFDFIDKDSDDPYLLRDLI